MKAKDIKAAIAAVCSDLRRTCTKHSEAIETAHAKYRADVEVIQTQCRHRWKQHYCYETATFRECEICGKETRP